MIGHNTNVGWLIAIEARAIIIIACSLLIFMSLFTAFSTIRTIAICIYFSGCRGRVLLLLLLLLFLSLSECLPHNHTTANCTLCARHLFYFIFYLHMWFDFIIRNESEYVRVLLIFSNHFNETFSSLFIRWLKIVYVLFDKIYIAENKSQETNV